ncbi:N-acetylglucosamine-6-phosphate deacetylase [Rhodopirellula halodulae]|uniref:N-acetylglucosamine-6-phosphate deacetylase n=1 Tax=Rhodopirellula halodulae TaxID=2894198 RepID=UPI001E3367DC|nr:N-acetylglucosamine-6-phosphate deacetylase [Rhodopirellula sp. JC737]MCC9655414.1 N-acetylglucosamine-6-phosphate deacetylase [Rhodopirellula sp. JC737]
MSSQSSKTARYVDLQVNGYAGVDFNADSLSTEQVRQACDAMRNDHVDSCLATVITDSLDAMITRISRLADAAESDSEIAGVISGIHVEGPFLSPVNGYVGAHPPTAIREANRSDAERLVEAGRGRVRLLTLAPEQDRSGAVTRWLSDQGIIVAAGHTNASLSELDTAIDNGLKMFTHLGNACPPDIPRHDNIIQRVLSRAERLSISFIADGFHIPMMALRNYLNCVPDGNVVIVSDAISAAGLGPGTYHLAGQDVHVDEDGAAWAACRTHFAGCATPVQAMVGKLQSELGMDARRIDQWTRINPAGLLAAC